MIGMDWYLLLILLVGYLAV